MADWYDIDQVREDWISAPLNDDVLQELLDEAERQVIAYAPKRYRLAYEAATVEEPFIVPGNLRYAQRRQCENLFNAGRVDASGSVGEGSFVMTPHPLDWHVKQIIRPRTAVPRVR